MKVDICLQIIFLTNKYLNQLKINFLLRMKRIVAFFILIFFICVTTGPTYAITNTTPFPEFGAEAAILIDGTTGKILFEKNKDKILYPASTTKVMTALLTLENLPLDQVVTIDRQAASTGGTSAKLVEGEQLTVKDLLYGLLLVSGNDAAVALAKTVSPNVETFSSMMNEKAKELGAMNTHFANPHGLHDDIHYTTAYDLALIAKKAMANPVFRNMVASYQWVVPPNNLSGERLYITTNRILYDETYLIQVNGQPRSARYEGATGIKTGYTPEAGNCLIASAKQGDTELIAVVLKSSDEGRFADCINMLDFGFANYKTVMVMRKGAPLEYPRVKNGAVRRVGAVASETVALTLPIKASEDIVKTEIQFDTIKAPVAKGQKIGVINVYQVGELIHSVEVTADHFVSKGGILSTIGVPDSQAQTGWFILSLIAVVLVGVFSVLIKGYIKKKNKIEIEYKIDHEEKTPQEQAWEAWVKDLERRKKSGLR